MRITMPQETAAASAHHRNNLAARSGIRRPVAVPSVDAAQLIALHPTAYHMAEDGSWPSIRERGLLSTEAIVDLYQPGDDIRAQILTVVRRKKITLAREGLPDVTIRDQLPAKFLRECLHEGVTVQDYLDALNGRVFFWLSAGRLKTLLGARQY